MVPRRPIALWLMAVSAVVGAAVPRAAADDAMSLRVKMKTSMGSIVLELDGENAPQSVLNFAHYVEAKYYDGLIFHRVITGAFVQAGRYLPNMDKQTEGLSEPVRLEAYNGLSNVRGTIAMVHGLAPHSATSEFLINVADNSVSLDSAAPQRLGYAVFGHVVKGMDVMDRIAAVSVGPNDRFAAGMLPVVPTKPVIIKSVRFVSKRDREAVAAIERSEQARLAELDAQTPENLRAKQKAMVEKEFGKKFTRTDLGNEILDVRVGPGPFPIDGDTVVFRYRGWLVNGREFESNLADTYPARKELRKLVRGLRQVFETMNVGTRRIAIIPPELAYGAEGIPRGNPPSIPPNAVLFFDIDLLDITATPAP